MQTRPGSYKDMRKPTPVRRLLMKGVAQWMPATSLPWDEVTPIETQMRESKRQDAFASVRLWNFKRQLAKTARSSDPYEFVVEMRRPDVEKTLIAVARFSPESNPHNHFCYHCEIAYQHGGELQLTNETIDVVTMICGAYLAGHVNNLKVHLCNTQWQRILPNKSESASEILRYAYAYLERWHIIKPNVGGGLPTTLVPAETSYPVIHKLFRGPYPEKKSERPAWFVPTNPLPFFVLARLMFGSEQ